MLARYRENDVNLGGYLSLKKYHEVEIFNF